MVKYNCDRCGFNTTIKTRMLRHLKRKYICKPKLKDIEISIIYNKYFNNNQQKKNDLEGNLSWYKCGTNDNKCIPLCPNINSKVDTIVSCRYCSKTFSDRHGRWKHEKLRCKRKNETFNIYFYSISFIRTKCPKRLYFYKYEH